MALRADGGAGNPALRLPLLLAWLTAALMNGRSAKAAEVPAGSAEQGLNANVSMELQFGACTVTCGIGFREVLLTSGCPGSEAKCIFRVEECRGPVDCGWGIPIPEGHDCMKMLCISIPPENRFKYVWKMFASRKASHILPHDSAVMEVCRDTHSVAFQCETQENGTIIASVKYKICARTETQREKLRRTEAEQSNRTKIDATLVVLFITGVIVIVGLIFATIFLIVRFWAVGKSVWESKFRQDSQYRKLSNKGSLPNVE
ncbi:sperm acrosome membrane-associated protein 1 [Heliangelus exortis]|uniref:sperm acrosome membrane-associated protein 1 n=1 Tax=Heliangelus exortis TaxID=472823 RepID=UPI003A8FE81C